MACLGSRHVHPGIGPGGPRGRDRSRWTSPGVMRGIRVDLARAIARISAPSSAPSAAGGVEFPFWVASLEASPGVPALPRHRGPGRFPDANACPGRPRGPVRRGTEGAHEGASGGGRPMAPGDPTDRDRFVSIESWPTRSPRPRLRWGPWAPRGCGQTSRSKAGVSDPRPSMSPAVVPQESAGPGDPGPWRCDGAPPSGHPRTSSRGPHPAPRPTFQSAANRPRQRRRATPRTDSRRARPPGSSACEFGPGVRIHSPPQDLRSMALRHERRPRAPSDPNPRIRFPRWNPSTSRN